VSWNKDARAKYRASEAFSGAIVCADQNEDGTLFAFSVGYDWSRGFEGQKEF
jgi:mRNA export factor